MAVASLGTDTAGSITYPSAVNGLYGIRPALNTINGDGIVPLFKMQDTVGPMSRSIDDLVRVYSVIAENGTFFEQFLKLGEAKNYRVGYIGKFLEARNFSMFNMTISLKVDDEIGEAFRRVVGGLRDIGVQMVEVEMSDKDYDSLMKVYERIAESFLGSSLHCTIKNEFNEFFNDAKVFGNDSPYKSFEAFYNSDLQQSYWTQFWKIAMMLNMTDCSKLCANFELFRDFMKTKIVEKWIKDYGVDFLMVPTAPEVAPILEEYPSMMIGASLIFSYSTFNILNVPSGFSKATEKAPDGLPIGVSFIAAQEKLVDAFRVAKMYDEAFLKVKRLPKLTPLLSDKCLSGACNALLNKSMSITALLTLVYRLLADYVYA